ncbi:MAG: hypothetical protein ACFCUT_12960 [Kiloniellaceae bacterium]
MTRQAGDYPDKYTWVPDEIGGMNRLLKERHPDLLADYNRYVLLSFMSSFSLDGSRYRLPASVAQLYIRELERIFLQAETFEDSFFDVSDDGFLKDLAILTHRLIPVGAEFAEGGAGIPRRILFAGGARQFFRSLWFVAVRCGGLRPFFALHAHTLALDDFNPTGWLKSYHRLAELVELNPQMKGWLSASWFLDPALETVSPHLAYLRKVPVENGAALLFVCHHRDGTSGALSKSPGRRRLFDEGKYVPATYMRIWPRKALIAWSRRRGKEPGLPLG